MYTGLKILYRKTKKLLKQPDLLFSEEPTTFSGKGIPKWKLDLKLYSLANELSDFKLEEKIGGFHCVPHPIALEVWNKLLRFNPNNLGNWFLNDQNKLDGTRRVERNLIKMMVNLYGGKSDEWEGYVTSGATESNIYSAWIARNLLLKKFNSQKICQIVTDLTHYSIFKAADIVGVGIFTTKLNRDSWSMDIDELEKVTENLYKKGYRGFILPLTLGYTQTGTSDDYEEIVARVKEIERKFGVLFFVSIDAALNGLVYPFTKKIFRPLRNPHVQTFCVDFHKAGMAPIPCGIVIYRKGLRKYIEKEIPYINENDNTLLGTRSGIPPVAAYFTVLTLGKEGTKDMLNTCMENKEKFKRMVQTKFSGVEMAGDKHGISVGLISTKQLPKEFLEKWDLFSKRQKFHFSSGDEDLFIYKAAFLPKPKN